MRVRDRRLISTRRPAVVGVAVCAALMLLVASLHVACFEHVRMGIASNAASLRPGGRAPAMIAKAVGSSRAPVAATDRSASRRHGAGAAGCALALRPGVEAFRPPAAASVPPAIARRTDVPIAKARSELMVFLN